MLSPKDIKLVELFYETADLKAELETYYENNSTEKYAAKAGVNTTSLIHKIITKIKEFIQKMINGLHEFGETIVRKIESARVKSIVAKRMRGVRGKVRAVTRDKEYRRFVDGVTKINMKGISEMRNTYDAYMKHKISYEKFKSRMREIDENMARSTKALAKAMGDKKVFELDETAGTPMDVEQFGKLIIDTTEYQELMVKKCIQKAKDEQKKLDKEATEHMKRQKIKVHMEAADETTSQRVNEEASVIQNISRAMAEAERTTIGNILRFFNGVGLAGGIMLTAAALGEGQIGAAVGAGIGTAVGYKIGDLEARGADALITRHRKNKIAAANAKAQYQQELRAAKHGANYESFDEEMFDILGVNEYDEGGDDVLDDFYDSAFGYDVDSYLAYDY